MLKMSEVAQVCWTVPSNWVDSEGDDCETYSTQGWCDDLMYASTLLQYAVDGVSALHACCQCGGGSPYDPSQACFSFWLASRRPTSREQSMIVSEEGFAEKLGGPRGASMRSNACAREARAGF